MMPDESANSLGIKTCETCETSKPAATYFEWQKPDQDRRNPQNLPRPSLSMSGFGQQGHRKNLFSTGQAATLDLERLENVCKGETKTKAACPACREAGRDAKGDHLVIFPDGRFACVVFQGQTALAKAHRQRIFRLAGARSLLGTHRSTGQGGPHPRRGPAAQMIAPSSGGIVLGPPPRTIVRTHEDLARLVASLNDVDVAELALAVEGAADDTLRLLTLYVPPVVPVPAVIDVLAFNPRSVAPLFERMSGKTLVVHGAQETLRLLTQWQPGVKPGRLSFWCTWIAAKLVSNGLDDRYDLETLLQTYLHVTVANNTTEAARGQNRPERPSITRAADQARHLLTLKKRLAERMSTEGLNRTFLLESRLVPVTHALNENGWQIDLPALRAKRERMVTALGAPGATDTASLQRRIAHTDGWLRHIDQDGRLRCRYNSLGVVTGRFSASAPNLQNVPRGHLREVFGAAEGCSLVIADLSQIELRIVALVAGEGKMLDIFRAGEDLHRLTAAAVLCKAPDHISGEDRQLGKTTNCGLIYGQGVAGFVRHAQRQGVDLTETQATRIRDRFFEAYPGIAGWHQRARDLISAHTLTVGRTIIGRRRYLAADTSNWDQFQARTNYVVQGSAAELFKTALVEIFPRLETCGARLVGVVHDEVIVEAASSVTTTVMKLLELTFEEAFVRLFNRRCERRFGQSLPELFQDRPACEVKIYVCANWAAKGD